MERFTLEITEEQIIEYLKKYKNYYKYYEPLFIQYLKENNIDNKLTDEFLEILTGGNIKFDNSGQLPCFDTAPSNIKNLDITGIYHIFIPAFRYYYPKINKLHVNTIYDTAAEIADKLELGLNRYLVDLNSTLNNYEICKSINLNQGIVTFNIGREYSRKQLMAYESFYGREEVKKVRKIIREG